jgi:uncharacterized protein Yka (UPF0111/DUF47 family)
MRKKQYDYFEGFERLGNYAVRAANMLCDVITNFDPEMLEENMNKLHEIEHEADLKNHKFLARLAKEFITTIEREDIMSIANHIDDVTDTIDDVLLKMYMFDIRNLRAEAIEMVDVIVKCCNALEDALKRLKGFKKSQTIQQGLIDINNWEEDGDRIYIKAIRTLVTTCTDPIEIFKWTQIYDALELCCDSCEHVAEVIETTILKNT